MGWLEEKEKREKWAVNFRLSLSFNSCIKGEWSGVEWRNERLLSELVERMEKVFSSKVNIIMCRSWKLCCSSSLFFTFSLRLVWTVVSFNLHGWFSPSFSFCWSDKKWKISLPLSLYFFFLYLFISELVESGLVWSGLAFSLVWNVRILCFFATSCFLFSLCPSHFSSCVPGPLPWRCAAMPLPDLGTICLSDLIMGIIIQTRIRVFCCSVFSNCPVWIWIGLVELEWEKIAEGYRIAFLLDICRTFRYFL